MSWCFYSDYCDSLDGDPSDPFSISNGVQQGCILAPTLFSTNPIPFLTFRILGNSGKNLFRAAFFQSMSKQNFLSMGPGGEYLKQRLNYLK